MIVHESFASKGRLRADMQGIVLIERDSKEEMLNIRPSNNALFPDTVLMFMRKSSFPL